MIEYTLYIKRPDFPGAEPFVAEDSGSSKLRGEESHVHYFQNPGSPIRDSSSTSRPYRFSGDTLYDLYNPGRRGLTMIRSTATHNLRPHWRMFHRPVDWALE